MNVVGQSRYGDNSRFSMMPNSPGIATGNPAIDAVISMLLSGKNFIPPPKAGQGVYDSMLLKERSNNFLTGMKSSVGSSLIMQKLGGLNTNSTMGNILGTLGANPNGVMDSSLLRAVNGGNPVQAMMRLNAGMTGNTMAQAFGSNSNASVGQVQAIHEAMRKQLFEQKQVTSAEVSETRERAGKEFGKRNLKGATADFFEDSIVTDEKGDRKLDYNHFKQNADKYAKKAIKTADQAVLAAYKEAVNTSNGLQDFEATIGTNVDSRVNFQKTRGFEIEDLSATFVKAADLGMAYDPNQRFTSDPRASKKNAANLSGKFFENIGGVARAVSDLTGAETAEEGLGQLNDLIGTSNVNLADSGDSKKMEEMLRGFKGAARAAGVSIDAVNEILSISKNITSTNSSMMYAGGLPNIEVAMKSVKTSSALMATMGPDWTRQNGGAGNVQQTTVATLAANKDEPIVKQLGAWASAINQSQNMSPAQKKAALAELSAAAKDPNTTSQGGYSALTSRVGAMLGVSQNQALAIGNSTLAQQAGAEFVAEEAFKGNDLGFDNAAGAGLMNNWRRTATNSLVKGHKVYNKDGSLMTDSQRIAAAEIDVGTGARLHTTLQKYGIQSNAIDKMFSDPRNKRNFEMQTGERNPIFQREMAFLNADQANYQSNSREYALKHAKLQASLGQNFVQEFFSGNMSGGLAGIKDAFLAGETQDRAGEIMGSLKRVSEEGEGNLASFGDAFFQVHGGKEGLSEADVRKNLALTGVEGADADSIIARRAAFNKDDLVNAGKVGETLTMNQVMNASLQWEGSAAELKGMKKKEVLRAAEFFKNTGIGSKENMDKFGGRKFQQNFKDLVISPGQKVLSSLATRDMIASTEANADKAYESWLGSSNEKNGIGEGEREAQLQALRHLGLVKEDAKGINVDTAGAMRMMNEDSILGDSSVKDIMDRAAGGTLDNATRDKLLKSNLATADGDSGNLTIDESALKIQAGKEAGLSILRKNGSLVSNAQAIAGATEKDNAQQAKQLTAESFENLTSSIDSNSLNLAKVLEAINTTLQSFNS